MLPYRGFWPAQPGWVGWMPKSTAYLTQWEMKIIRLTMSRRSTMRIHYSPFGAMRQRLEPAPRASRTVLIRRTLSILFPPRDFAGLQHPLSCVCDW